MLTVSASSSHIGDGVQKRSTTETTSTAPPSSNDEGLFSSVRAGGRPPSSGPSDGGAGTSGDRTSGFTRRIDGMVAAPPRPRPATASSALRRPCGRYHRSCQRVRFVGLGARRWSIFSAKLASVKDCDQSQSVSEASLIRKK